MKIRRKKIIVFILGLIVFSFIKNISVMADNREINSVLDNKNINPKVKNLEGLGDEFTITENVNIIGRNTADKAAVDFLISLLNSYDIGITESFDMNNTTIILGEVSGEEKDKEVVDILHSINKSDDEALTKSEGYILNSSKKYNNGEKGIIVIAGKDNEGTYYGVSSFKQLLNKVDKSIKIPEVNISDYPSIEFRGIIEDFYGEQWSHEDRKNILNLAGEHKINSYIYGAKDDLYRSSKWREVYSSNEAKKIKELVSIADKNNIDFVWSMQLGESIEFTEQDYSDLLTKCKYIYELGVRSFAIFFDDGTTLSEDANKQSKFLNRLKTDLEKEMKDIESIIMGLAEYKNGFEDSKYISYLNSLGETLDKDIEIIWKASSEIEEINKNTLESINNNIRREVYVYYGFSKNDYCRDRLLLGESYGISNDLSNAKGFLLSPMNQVEASKFSLYSIANYSWNVEEYDSRESFKNAIEFWVPEVKEDFEIFSIHNADSYTDYNKYRRKESENMISFIDDFKENIKSGNDISDSSKRLLEEFALIENSGRNIYEKCEDENLIKEIEPWVLSFEQLGIAGQNIIKSILAIEEENFSEWWENYSGTKQALDKMKMISSSNNFGERRGASVSTSLLTPFVEEMFDISEKLYKEKAEYANDHEISSIINERYDDNKVSENNNTNIDELRELKLEIKDDGTIAYPKVNNLVIEKNEYIGFELNDLNEITGLTLEFETSDNTLNLEYSVNGVEWTDYKEGYTVAKYIRAINNGEEPIKGKLEKFKVIYNINNEPVITTNISNYKDDWNKLIDENKSTYLLAEEQKKGLYYQIDLGGQVTLNDVTVYMDKIDYVRSGVLEVSSDGEKWKIINNFSSALEGNSFKSNLMRSVNNIVGKLDGSLRKDDEEDESINYKEIKGDAQGEDYRYIRLRVTDDSEYSIKINEIEFNKEIMKEKITSVSGNPSGEFSKCVDGKFNTAYIAGVNPKEGDSLLYKMTTINQIDSIKILQNPNNISNGVVKVRVLGDEWVEVGRLDKSFNSIDLSFIQNKNILDIKIEWAENGVKPFIYEIIPGYEVAKK